MSTLVGSWSLTSFHIDRAGGERSFPLDEGARGRIIYAESGRMIAMLSKGARAAFSGGALERAADASEVEKARAFDEVVAYSGRYEVDGERVKHHVELSLTPSVEGSTFERRALLDGDQLELSYNVRGRRGEHTYVLRWQRE